MHLMFGFNRRYDTDKQGELTFKYLPTVYEVIDYIKSDLSDHGTISVVTSGILFDETKPLMQTVPKEVTLASYENGHIDYNLLEDEISPLLKYHDSHVDKVHFYEAKNGDTNYVIILKN